MGWLRGIGEQGKLLAELRRAENRDTTTRDSDQLHHLIDEAGSLPLQRVTDRVISVSGLPGPAASEKKSRKRTSREQEEFEVLSHRIEEWERELHALGVQMADPACFSKEGFINEAKSRCAKLEKTISVGYSRWEELEQKGN